MTGMGKWKLALYLAGIFGAGAVSGWFVGVRTAKQTMFTPPRWDEIVASLRHSLHSRLDLAPEQAKRIDAIVNNSSEQLRLIHEAHMKRIWQAISNRNAQISAVLNPEQQKQFEAFEKERRESWRRKDFSRGKDLRRGKRSDREGRRGARSSDGTNGTNRSATTLQ